MRQLVTGQFYQSLGESGIAVNSIPPDQLKAIIAALADGVFAALASIETESNGPDGAGPDPGPSPAAPTQGGPEERLLWRGRPYLTLGTRYELTNQRLRILRGLIGNTVEEIELVRVRDTKVKQHMGERMLNVGDITILSADQTTPTFELRNVTDPMGVRELIRKAVMEEKERRGMRYREDMADESH
jgi:hypothetical protein